MLFVIRTLYTHTRRTGSPLSIGMTIHDFLWLLVKGFSWIITDIDEMFFPDLPDFDGFTNKARDQVNGHARTVFK